MASEPILELTDVRKYFRFGQTFPWSKGGHVRAVDGLSLSLRQGETLSLVGESGCGKTTTARMILSLLQPDAGSIKFKGMDITRLQGRALRRRRSSIQAVFQDPWSSLNPRARVESIVGEPLLVNHRLRGSALRERVGTLLQSVGLEPSSARRFPHEFSGGQRQRIAVARAISLEPEVIVLDEPVSALDVSIRAQIMNLLKDIQARLGVSYLIIAHDLATVRYLSDRVAVMYLGKMMETSGAEDIFLDSRHPYTRALISAAAPVGPHSPEPTRIILHGEIPSPAYPPPGCSFHPRCWLYERLKEPERCRAEVPLLRSVGTARHAACHFAEHIDRTPKAPVVGKTVPGN